MTFESRPCHFTELPFLISVTAGKTRQIIDGGDQGAGGAGGAEGQGARGRGRWISLGALDILRRLARSFAMRGTSGNLCFSDNFDEYTRFLKIA